MGCQFLEVVDCYCLFFLLVRQWRSPFWVWAFLDSSEELLSLQCRIGALLTNLMNKDASMFYDLQLKTSIEIFPKCKSSSVLKTQLSYRRLSYNGIIVSVIHVHLATK